MRRRLGFFLIIGAAVSLVAVSTAWACGVLGTLNADKASTAPNTTVTLTGEHYGQPSSNTPVSIRLNSRTATPLTTVTPDLSGRINKTVTIPASTSPGWYVILATQNRLASGVDSGVPKSGTPGRTTLRVQGAAAASRRRGGGVAVTPWGSGSKPTGGSGAALAANAGSSSSPAFLPTLLGILLSLGLLGTGLTLVARSRTASRPQLGA